MLRIMSGFVFFFFNDTATTEIYTLSLHDALPISFGLVLARPNRSNGCTGTAAICRLRFCWARSEEHTSELQSRLHLVCRLLLEKKKRRKWRAMTAECRACRLC